MTTTINCLKKAPKLINLENVRNAYFLTRKVPNKVVSNLVNMAATLILDDLAFADFGNNTFIMVYDENADLFVRVVDTFYKSYDETIILKNYFNN